MSFTIHEDEQIDSRVARDLEICRARVLNSVPSMDAMILVGGFGRGEGTVHRTDSGIEPQNDYDLVIICEEKPDRGTTKRLSAELASELAIPWVDLIPIRAATVAELPFTMFNYDLKYGGRVVYGEDSILQRIPEYDPAEMPLREGEILLFNRLVTALEAIAVDQNGTVVTNGSPGFTLHQASKVALAGCDAELLIAGQYHHSYVEKARRFRRLIPDAETAGVVERAAKVKCAPELAADLDPARFWGSAVAVFLKSFLRFAAAYHGRPFANWEDYLSHHRAALCKPYRRYLLDRLRRRPTVVRAELERAELALLLVISGEFAGRRAHTVLRRARRTLSYARAESCAGFGAERLRSAAVDCWYAASH